MACPSAGNCSGDGYYPVFGKESTLPFVVTEHNGTWHEAVRTEALVVNQVGGRWRFAQVIPGVVKLDREGDSRGIVVDCWSANQCAAGGFFDFEGSTRPFPFVATER